MIVLAVDEPAADAPVEAPADVEAPPPAAAAGALGAERPPIGADVPAGVGVWVDGAVVVGVVRVGWVAGVVVVVVLSGVVGVVVVGVVLVVVGVVVVCAAWATGPGAPARPAGMT